MKTMLYFVEIRDSKIIEYEKYLKFIAPSKQEQIQKFRFDIDKKLSLFADLFVRYLACTKSKVSNSELTFEKNSFGKPYLLGIPAFQYNVSHTKNAIVIGISDKSIGVDVEKTKAFDLKIAERFFCDNEIAYILSSEEQNKAFYEIWTKKEAYIKWAGKGLSLPLTSFDVTDFKLSKMLSLFEVGEYILTICSKTNFKESDLVIYNEEQAIKILSTLT